jgi:hypothetical protein
MSELRSLVYLSRVSSAVAYDVITMFAVIRCFVPRRAELLELSSIFFGPGVCFLMLEFACTSCLTRLIQQCDAMWMFAANAFAKEDLLS